MAESPEQDWYLREWMEVAGKIQADIIRELGWERGRTSKIYNGRQPYCRGDVNALARFLNIRPYELLMPPAEAIALRQLRETAYAIAAEHSVAFDPRPPSGKGRRAG